MTKRNAERITADAPKGLKKLVNEMAGKHDLKISDLVSYLVMKSLIELKDGEIEERLIPIRSLVARFGLEFSDLVDQLNLSNEDSKEE
ncbi:MAG: hypothetical protein AAF902_21280 [Chloroflexota bacterium]